MDEISNKTLATLLVVAIVISLAGTFFAMRGVSQITNVISGAQTVDSAAGTAKVNITESVSITLTQPTVDFGNGARNSSTPSTVECNLTTDDTSAPTCWEATGTYAPADFELENDGNVYVNVTINSTASADFFNSCTGSTTIVAGDARYAWEGQLNSTSLGCNENAGDLIGSDGTEYTFTGVEQLLCKNLSANNDHDDFNVSINISIPSGPTGVCNNAVTFYGRRNY